MTDDHDSDDTIEWLAPARRTVIKAAAVISAGSVGHAAAQEDDENGDQDVAETFELLGETGGWVGVSPDEIEEEQNPTLLMNEDEEYEVGWENGDGAAHNFAIEGEDNEVFIETDYVSSIGETASVTFTAEEEFDHYICHPHRKTMRGRIVFDESELEDAEEDDGEDDVDEEEQEEELTEEPSEVFYLELDEDGWIGESPDEIAGETNPTLSVEAGETYAIVWTLRTERERHKPGHNIVIHDEEGNHFTYTEFLSNEGASRTLTFTADEEMVYYSDQTQLDVRGDIAVTEGNGDGDDRDDGEGENGTDGEDGNNTGDE